MIQRYRQIWPNPNISSPCSCCQNLKSIGISGKSTFKCTTEALELLRRKYLGAGKVLIFLPKSAETTPRAFPAEHTLRSSCVQTRTAHTYRARHLPIFPAFSRRLCQTSRDTGGDCRSSCSRVRNPKRKKKAAWLIAWAIMQMRKSCDLWSDFEYLCWPDSLF